MLHALRLTFNAPRRIDFRRVTPPISISYGVLTDVTEEEVAELIAEEAIFRDQMGKGHIQRISAKTAEEIEARHKQCCAEELRRPHGEAQVWSGVSKSKDGLPTIEISDGEQTVEANTPGASHVEAEKKQREKLRAYSANSKKVSTAKAKAKTENAAA